MPGAEDDELSAIYARFDSQAIRRWDTDFRGRSATRAVRVAARRHPRRNSGDPLIVYRFTWAGVLTGKSR